MTSEPKPGALAPAGVGRSRPATAGSAFVSARAAAVADGGGVMRAVPRAVGADGVGGAHPTGSRPNSQAAWRRGRCGNSGAPAQPRQQPDAGIAVSGVDAELL